MQKPNPEETDRLQSSAEVEKVGKERLVVVMEQIDG